MICPTCGVNESKVTITPMCASASLPLTHVTFGMQCVCGKSGRAYQGTDNDGVVHYVWGDSTLIGKIV